jgi:hypothetical protein
VENIASIFRIEEYANFAGFFLGLLFDPEVGGDMFFRNVG